MVRSGATRTDSIVSNSVDFLNGIAAVYEIKKVEREVCVLHLFFIAAGLGLILHPPNSIFFYDE